MRFRLLNIALSLAFISPITANSSQVPEGFQEGTYIGNSKCELSHEAYSCDSTYTFSKYSLTEKYNCTNGLSGVDGIEFKLNPANGELEFPNSPNFKLHCKESICSILNDEDPLFSDNYIFDRAGLSTESICQARDSDERAPKRGRFLRKSF